MSNPDQLGREIDSVQSSLDMRGDLMEGGDNSVEIDGEKYGEVIFDRLDYFQDIVESADLEPEEVADAFQVILDTLNTDAFSAESFEAMERDLARKLDRVEEDLGLMEYVDVPFEISAEEQAQVDRMLDENDRFTAAEISLVVLEDFEEQLRVQNEALEDSLAELTEKMGSLGTALEPSSLLSNAFNTFGGGNREAQSIHSVQADLSRNYLYERRETVSGMAALKRVVRESVEHGQPMMINEAWDYLVAGEDTHGFFDRGMSHLTSLFSEFSDSPDGRFFKATFIEGKVDDPNVQAQYTYERASEILTLVGGKDAHPYFMSVINDYPGTEWASKAQERILSMGERIVGGAMSCGDFMLRLDMLAVGVAAAPLAIAARGSAVGGRVAAWGARAARVAPRASKIARLVPGVPVIAKGVQLGKVGNVLRFGTNFGLEIGKFAGAVTVADELGGEKAAYAVGMLCFFSAGFVGAFENSVGKGLQAELSSGNFNMSVEGFARSVADKAGGARALRRMLVRGIERKAEAAGQVINRANIVGQVTESLQAVGLTFRKAVAKSRVGLRDMARKVHSEETGSVYIGSSPGKTKGPVAAERSGRRVKIVSGPKPVAGEATAEVAGETAGRRVKIVSGPKPVAGEATAEVAGETAGRRVKIVSGPKPPTKEVVAEVAAGASEEVVATASKYVDQGTPYFAQKYRAIRNGFSLNSEITVTPNQVRAHIVDLDGQAIFTSGLLQNPTQLSNLPYSAVEKLNIYGGEVAKVDLWNFIVAGKANLSSRTFIDFIGMLRKGAAAEINAYNRWLVKNNFDDVAFSGRADY
jgi:hypothetical protein